jgi:NAD(P)-dependent dehydrogenase (short-subunit alcohol dehydrogenase family)
MDLGLADRPIIVAGGASTIGRATSLLLAAEGADVLIADLDIAQAERVAQEPAAKGRIAAYATDVTDVESVRRLAGHATDTYGSVAAIVNVAGWDKVDRFVNTTTEFWRKVIDINYVGVLNMTHTFLPILTARERSSIVHVASDAGRIGEYKEAVYGGCKAAVINFSKSIAREAGPQGLRSNVVCPGLTLPDSDAEYGELSMHASLIKRGTVITDETIARAIPLYPLRKLGKPTDIASAIAFLLSDVSAGHITGQTLSVSGGYSMV